MELPKISSFVEKVLQRFRGELQKEGGSDSIIKALAIGGLRQGADIAGLEDAIQARRTEYYQGREDKDGK